MYNVQIAKVQFQSKFALSVQLYMALSILDIVPMSVSVNNCIHGCQ